MLALVVLLSFGLSGRRMLRVRRVPAWRSAASIAITAVFDVLA